MADILKNSEEKKIPLSKEVIALSKQPWFPQVMRELGYELIRHGYWIGVSQTNMTILEKLFFPSRVFECSVCGNYLDFDGVNAGRGSENFCPNCGAKMDEELKANTVTINGNASTVINNDNAMSTETRGENMPVTMTFPKTVDEFMEKYKIVDSDEVYTNGAELVPIFRMKQWFEHVDAEPKQAYVIVDEDGNMECSNCGSSFCFDNYCAHCGAKLIGERKYEVEDEVVMCKDCKHRPTGGTEGDPYIEFPDDVCPCKGIDYRYPWIPQDDYFCAWGERKEDAD